MDINLNLIGRYASENGAEIPAFDSASKQLFVVAGDVVEILNLSAATNITKIEDLPLNTEAVGEGFALIPNSVAVGVQGSVSEGIIAVALAIVETATGNHQRGEVQFFDSTTGEFLGKQTVGFLPDMVAFTPDGTKVLTANEGEPNEDYTFDPEGSISIIDLSGGVDNATLQEATFTAFNDQVDQLRASGVRIFGPNATVAQDVEPEYIAFSGDGTKAWVTLQENNAVAIVDIATATVESIVPLGFKDHSLEGNGFDASDRDGIIDIKNHSVFGMYLPDAIASYTVNGQTYYITANEGDARLRPSDDNVLPDLGEGDLYNEESGIDDLILDPVAFPNFKELQQEENLGRLTVTNTLGQSDRAVFVSELDGSQEVTPVTTEARGNALAWIDDNGFLQVQLEVTGLDFGALNNNPLTETTADDVTLLHIHEALRGANGGVVWNILTDTDTVITIAEDGTANITSIWQENTIEKTAQEEDTEYYFNLHTTGNPGGEIRGQIVGQIAYDEIYAFGARSFTIWNSEGNLVFDSGDDFERITAEVFPDYFNASNSNNNFDNRSDNKGPEPEGVTVGTINGQNYAFVGLERIGGVMVYNVTNPETPEFVQYINTRNFEQDPETNLTDSGPEGLIFVSGEKSPNGKPLLIVSNEVSQTTTVFEVQVPQTNFTLQLLHASDQEAGIPALQDAIGFSAVMNALDAQYENTLKLTSGDLFIAGPFFNASFDIYGQQGIADILVQNALGWDAAAVGNHEFDAGTSVFYNAIASNPFIQGVGIDPDTGYIGANFPYLSTNLDYSTDSSNLKNLVVDSGEAPLPNSLTESVVIDVNGEQVGIIGAVVPYLPAIANIGGITMLTNPTSTDIEVNAQFLAENIQPFVDELVSQGINKIILMTHLQQFEMEQALATKLSNVDIIMGGGSHRVMANTDDPLRQDETQTPPELLQPYPQVFQDADGNNVYLINTGANYRYLGQLIVEFDPEGKIIEIGDDSGTFATDIEGVDRLYEEEITTFEQVKELANPEIVAVVDNVGEFINSSDGNIFGNTEVYLNGLRSSVRTEETNLGNLTADANLWYAQQYGLDIDISVKNGGGIRDQIGVSFIEGGTNELLQLPPQANPLVGKVEGDVSELDISNSLRFNNKLSVVDISAQGIKDLTEHLVARWAVGATPGQFGQIGGFSFSFDPDNTAINFTRDANGLATGVAVAGERIQNLVLNREDGTTEVIFSQGEFKVDPNATYTMVILDFLATGGDGYPSFYFDNVVRLDTLTPDNLPNNSDLPIGGEQDALAEYLAEFFPDATQAFNQADTPIEQDTRIQNLNFRDDTIIPFVPPAVSPLLFGGVNNDVFDAADPNDGFDGNDALLFTGGGNDVIDASAATVGNNRLFAGSGDDELYAGKSDRLFAAEGNDEIYLNVGQGGNRVYGGAGDDTFFLGTGDRLFGGADDDRFFVGTGGNNIITGGEGADQFWIVNGELPNAGNRITDFTQGVDVLGIGGNFGEQLNEFTDLSINTNSGITRISVNFDNQLRELVTLNGEFNLTANDFVFA